MAYLNRTAEILAWKGYINADQADGGHYRVKIIANEVILTWYHPTEAKPTDADVIGWELPFLKYEKRREWKAWASLINSRAYEADLPSAVDNMLTQDIRQAIRAWFNDFAAQENLNTTYTNAESKNIFKGRPRFDLILKAGEARKEGKTDVNAYTDPDLLEAYVVDDAKAVALHEAAYPGESPSLADLLAQYPADYE